MSQIVSSIGAMTLSSKEVSHFSAPSVNDPAQTALSIGFQFTSEDGEFRDETVSLQSSHQLENKTLPKTDDAFQKITIRNDAGHVSRRASTTEYVYTMLTEDTAAELVPLYSSWSLLCLGPATLYNPQKGSRKYKNISLIFGRH